MKGTNKHVIYVIMKQAVLEIYRNTKTQGMNGKGKKYVLFLVQTKHNTA
jgi:hypothetical protein